ncbi:MAG TPA: SPASM domain-containing protein, partial [Bacilli bacterium]|nr:SPASM domain-containing protein [Bacilli bacterium]
KRSSSLKRVHRERQQELLNELHVDNKAPCQSCALKHICAGGCYYEALERQGDYRSPNAHYCEWMHEWITTGLSAYVRILSRNPEFLERIA